MVGGSAPTASTSRWADRGCLPVARHTRTPRAWAALTAATTPGRTTLSSGTSVPSMSAMRRRYRGESPKGKAHLRPAAGAPVARLHELGGALPIFGGHHRCVAVQDRVEKPLVLEPVAPFLFHR